LFLCLCQELILGSPARLDAEDPSEHRITNVPLDRYDWLQITGIAFFSLGKKRGLVQEELAMIS
jgi:hypothetical protein